MNRLENLEKEFEKLISRSKIPEDPLHSKNTRDWVLKLRPNASQSLQIAALAHDIERAIPGRKVSRNKYSDYNTFKKAHAFNSARIALKILDKHGLNSELKNRIKYLIEHHEAGSTVDESVRPGLPDRELSVLKDADSLSFFQVNLPLYFQRNSEKETFFRMKWGYERLSERAKKTVNQFHYKKEVLNKLLKKLK